MIPEPCPTCNGYCCANHDEKFAPSLRYQHSGMKWHVCPDCDDGTYEVCGDPEPFIRERTYEDGIAEGERRATAAVVACLKGLLPKAQGTITKELLDTLADRIERGEHRREEEK